MLKDKDGKELLDKRFKVTKELDRQFKAAVALQGKNSRTVLTEYMQEYVKKNLK